MEAKSERTRRLIIEKSAHLFNRKGYHGTSMNDVMEATGLTKGGVYGHFGAKDEIVAESFNFAFYRVMDEIGVRVRNCDTAIAKLDAIIDFYRDFLHDSPIEGGCPLLNYSSYSSEAPPLLSKMIAKSTRVMLESLERIIEKGIKYGQIRPEIVPSVHAEMIFSQIQGALMVAKFTGEEAMLHRLLDRCKEDLRRELAR